LLLAHSLEVAWTLRSERTAVLSDRRLAPRAVLGRR
jgi:hypothetical protein